MDKKLIEKQIEDLQTKLKTIEIEEEFNNTCEHLGTINLTTRQAGVVKESDKNLMRVLGGLFSWKDTDEFTLLYKRFGRSIVCELYDNNDIGIIPAIGVATCHDDDEFDYELGIELAGIRAFIHYLVDVQNDMIGE